MRKHSGSHVWRAPFAPFAPGNIFEQNATILTRAASQGSRHKFADQLNYSLQNYTHWFNYTGPGYSNNGGVIHGNWETFTPSLFIVPPGQPTQKVTLLENPPGNEPRPPGANSNLQSFFEAVPMPTFSKVPSGGLTQATGTDKEICIIQGKQMWEMWKLEGEEGAYTFRFGAYIPDMTVFNGVLPNGWGARACGLALIGGLITIQDLAEVMRYAKSPSSAPEPHYHAIQINLPVTNTGEGPTAPATRADESANIPELIPAGKGFPKEGEANPAYPNKDAVAEGRWFAYPAASKPSEFGLSWGGTPISTWLFECVRRNGIFVGDGSGGVAVQFESMQAMGSPYSYCGVNPVAGAPGDWNSPPFGWVPAAMTNAECATIEETVDKENNLFVRALSEPANELEMLEPRAS
jgi:hypothetical protein